MKSVVKYSTCFLILLLPAKQSLELFSLLLLPTGYNTGIIFMICSLLISGILHRPAKQNKIILFLFKLDIDDGNGDYDSFFSE